MQGSATNCSPMPPERMQVTDDAALGGKLRLLQPKRGHRFGHDAILLAAAVPAQAGQHAVDLGAGIGAAGLALLTRVGKTQITLVEIDPALAALAAENITRNGFERRARAVTLDVGAPTRAFSSAGLAAGAADHVLMNPPFNDPAHQPSPDRKRRVAHAASKDTLPVWIRAASRLLRNGGGLTLIWRSDGLDAVLDALSGGYGATEILPIHPSAEKPAIRVIVRATKGSGKPLSLLPGLALNDEDNRPTTAAEAVLRGGAAL